MNRQVDLLATIVAEEVIKAKVESNEWKKLVNRTLSYEKQIIPLLQDYFESQEKAVISALNKYSKAITFPFLEKEFIYNQADELSEIIFPIIKQVVTKEAKLGMSALQKKVRDSLKDFNLDSRVLKAIQKQVATAASEITQTTFKRLLVQYDTGIELGEDLATIKDRIATVFTDAVKNRVATIARTEVLKASNEGRLSAYQQSGVVNKVRWYTAVDERRCSSCAALHDKVVKLNSEFIKGITAPPLHPNCFIDGQIPIYTVEGWKPIKDIKVGDLVLTHKGRFRKVTQLIRTLSEQPPSMVDVQLTNGRHRHTTLTATEDHPILLNGKWLPIKDAYKGMTLAIMSSNCKCCGKEIPFNRTYCSHSCLSLDITDKQWASNEHRENISKKTSAQMHREYTNGTRDPFVITERARKAAHERMIQDNRLNYPESRAKLALVTNTPYQRMRSSQRIRRTMQKMSQNGFTSSLELFVADVLNGLHINYIQQYSIDRFCVDFALPDYNIVIEADGEYWHQDKEKDDERQRIIESYGWQVIRFSGSQINSKLNRVEAQLTRLISNHDGLYSFMNAEIVKVRKWKCKTRKQLFNFSVEEDESYIAKGFVVHNCRCILLPEVDPQYLKSWLNVYKDIVQKMGTASSGNHGHGGRPGKRGGSISVGGSKSDKLNSAITQATKEYTDQGISPKEITHGHCYEWAQSVKTKCPEVVAKDIAYGKFMFGVKDLPYHVWVEHKGKAYDAESPKGVKDWKELNYFKFHINQDIIGKLKSRVMPTIKSIGDVMADKIGLAAIFKMGMPSSGNHGHGGRPGKVGGSVPAGGRGAGKAEGKPKRETRKGMRAGLTISDAQRAKNKVADAKKAKELGLTPTKRGADGKLTLLDGSPLPKHLTSGLARGGIPPGLEDVYVNLNARAVANGAYAVRGRSSSTGEIVGKYAKDATDVNMDKKWLKTAKLEKAEPAIEKKILKDMKSTEWLDVQENSACMRLIQVTAIRAGDENDTKFGVYGACTLQGRHAKVSGNTVTLDYIAKESVHTVVKVTDPFVVKDIKERLSRVKPNENLFETNYHGKLGLLNYCKSLHADEYTPKNFRTLRATQWAVEKIKTMKSPTSKAEYVNAIKEVCTHVGAKLGHVSAKGASWTTAKDNYVNPYVFSEWNKGGW